VIWKYRRQQETTSSSALRYYINIIIIRRFRSYSLPLQRHRKPCTTRTTSENVALRPTGRPPDRNFPPTGALGGLQTPQSLLSSRFPSVFAGQTLGHLSSFPRGRSTFFSALWSPIVLRDHDGGLNRYNNTKISWPDCDDGLRIKYQQ